MKTLHLYLTRQVLGTLLMTVMVFTFVMMIGSVTKEILGLLVGGQATLGLVARALVLLLPYVLVFALPMGLLTATLLVFGRFSADNELTAAKASGVSLVSLITPVLILSVLCSAAAAYINLDLAPRCRMAYKRLIAQGGLAQSANLIPERTYITDLDTNCIIYVGKVSGTNLEDVLIYEWRDNKVESYNRADNGVIQINTRLPAPMVVLTVVLSNAYSVTVRDGSSIPQPTPLGNIQFEYTNAPSRKERRSVDISDMDFRQLREELIRLNEQMHLPQSVGKISSDELREQMRKIRNQKKPDITLPIRVQLHRQVAFSFACIGFTLIGIPLGIRAHRRETTFGIAIALILVVIYYSFFILGQSFDTRPDLVPHLILWVPNFLFQAVGIVLLWRANRGL